MPPPNYSTPTAAVVDQIFAADYPMALKIVRLFAITQLNYRGPVGDLAWDRIRELTPEGVSDAIAFLAGYCSGLSPRRPDHYWELVPELLQSDRGNNGSTGHPHAR